MANKTNETLLGGREIDVEKSDGTKAKVKVKKVSHLKSGLLIEADNDHLKRVMLYTGFTEDELAGFTEESFFDLLEAGDEINDEMIIRLAGIQMVRTQKKMRDPHYRKLLEQASISDSSGGE
jgi:hypothetical protein